MVILDNILISRYNIIYEISYWYKIVNNLTIS